MTQQFQTKMQQITMLIVLLMLVIVVAQKVYAGTYAANPAEITQCSEVTSSEKMDFYSEIREFSWSPFIAFLTR